MVASKQEDAYEEEEKEKVTASQVTTLYAICIFYYLITFFSFYGGNYDSTIWLVGVKNMQFYMKIELMFVMEMIING